MFGCVSVECEFSWLRDIFDFIFFHFSRAHPGIAAPPTLDRASLPGEIIFFDRWALRPSNAMAHGGCTLTDGHGLSIST